MLWYAMFKEFGRFKLFYETGVMNYIAGIYD